MIPRYRRYPKRQDLVKVPTKAGRREYDRLISEEDKLPIGASTTIFDRRHQDVYWFWKETKVSVHA